MDQLPVLLEPCTAKCRGHSCCNCCGEAPAMHRTDGGRRFDRWDTPWVWVIKFERVSGEEINYEARF